MLNLKSNFQRGVHKAPVQIKWHSAASNYFPDLSWVHPIKLATKQNNDAPIPSQKHNLKKKNLVCIHLIYTVGQALMTFKKLEVVYIYYVKERSGLLPQ